MSKPPQRTSISEGEYQLRCRCGKTEGVAQHVTPRSGAHLVCYCEDCQTFGKFLDASGILNEYGGTQIFQLPPARVQITKGFENIRCIRLSPNGTYRFYADCCRTPIGNMKGPRFPFIGLICAFMDTDDSSVPGESRGVFGRDAIGDPPGDVAESITAGIGLKSARLLLWWWLRRKHRPNAFFDVERREPAVPVDIMSLEERDELKARSL